MVGRQTQQKVEEDRDLLLRAAGGDEQATRHLFRTYVGRIYRHVTRILGHGDADVEDVVQQVFLAALDGAEHFDGRSAVSTWMHGIATRRALDVARSRWRRERWARMVRTVGLAGRSSRPDHIHHALAEAEAVLAKLTPDQRAVFLLHEVEGYTFSEISEMTGVGISTLHGRLKAARFRVTKFARGGAGD